MRNLPLFIIMLLLFSSCIGPAEGVISEPQLTPYRTISTMTETPVPTAGVAAVTATPAATATPLVHIVSLGETISSIALKYDVSIDAILLANPAISPKVMIVGDAVIIPNEGIPSSIAIDPDLRAAVLVGQPNCFPSGGGLWCSVLLQNISDINLEFPVVTFNVLDAVGNVLSEKRAPAMMRNLAAGNSLPATVFFAAVPAAFDSVAATLFSVNGSPSENGALEVIVEEESTAIQTLSAEITGVMQVSAADGKDSAELTIAAAAFDAAGNVVGVRRMQMSVVLNERFDYELTVFSAGGEIAAIKLYTEAY
jgi:LysM repeat protein